MKTLGISLVIVGALVAAYGATELRRGLSRYEIVGGGVGDATRVERRFDGVVHDEREVRLGAWLAGAGLAGGFAGLLVRRAGRRRLSARRA